MWKRIVLGLDGSDFAAAAAEHALDFARLYDAEIEAAFVPDVRLAAPPLPPADMLGAPLDVTAAPLFTLEADERRRGEALLASFQSRAERDGARVTTFLETGVPARVLLARARGGDAVFLGRSGRGGGGEVGGTVRTVGYESVRPVFVAAREARKVKRILVAYDGTPEATRALRVAAEMDDRGRAGFQYVLLTVGDAGRAADETQKTALTYFQAHGIAPETLVRAGRPAPTIIAAADDLRCDLVVAGSFGAARWREMLLGSVTIDLLRSSRLPVLIHH